MHLIKACHFPGRHCASTGIRNIVNFHGISWSEAMCFGLGAGLGIWYLNIPGNSPSRLVHVRSSDLEKQFFVRIGCPFNWQQYDTPEESEQGLIECLDNGVPAIVQTDIYYLPYFNSGTHFPGHIITVWGYDEERRIFMITDTEREELLEVAFEDMRRARFSNFGFFDSKGNLFAPQKLYPPQCLSNASRKAINCNSRTLLENHKDICGISGLEQWLEELPCWADLEDWKWAARFTYQVIEKRGTGGGAFRLMYADFLEEASEYLPAIKSLGLPRLMKEAALSWQELAMALKEVSSAEKFDYKKVSRCLSKVRKMETQYHQKALML